MLKPPDGQMKTGGESRAYFLGTAFAMAAGGINGVLYPWLVTVYLLKPAEWIGVAQTAATLPMFLFLLHAGALTDRVELRRFIVVLNFLTIVPLAFLGVAAGVGRLDFWLVIAFGFAINAVGAFMMTARETALIQIAQHEGTSLQKMILTGMAVQFGSQIAGNVAGGFASLTGPLPLIAAQAVLLLLAGLLFLRLEKQPPRGGGTAQGSIGLSAIREGLAAAFASPRIWPFLVQNFLGGALFMGVWMVGMPLMLRDVYGQGSGAFAIVSIAFMVGVTAGTLTLSRLKEVERPGRLVLLSLIGSWLTLVGFVFTPPLWAVFGLMAWWGLCAGISMATARGVVQAAAAAHLRGRVVSIYQMAQMGGGPLGAILFGVLAATLGLQTALLVPVALVVAMWIAIRFMTPMWGLRRETAQAAGSNP